MCCGCGVNFQDPKKFTKHNRKLELDHKYNTRKMTDGERTVAGIKGMEGKRLMLKTLTGKAE